AKEEVGVVAGVKADGLFAGEGFFGMQGRVEPAGFARYGCGHGQEWIVRIDGAKGADFLHVIRAAPGNSARGKDGLERLKPAEAFIAELLEQGGAVQVKPGRLNIENHTETGQFADRIGGHEIGVGDARSGGAN